MTEEQLGKIRSACKVSSLDEAPAIGPTIGSLAFRSDGDAHTICLLMKAYDAKCVELAEVQAENERLKEEIKRLKDQPNSICRREEGYY